MLLKSHHTIAFMQETYRRGSDLKRLLGQNEREKLGHNDLDYRYYGA